MAGFPSFGGFGGQMMKPLGQMWNQGQPQMPQMGQLPTGQFPLNPGGPVATPGGGTTGAPLQMGQMPMQGQMPSYQQPQGQSQPFQGFQMPQGMPMGAQNAMGRMNGMLDQFNQWRTGMQDWRQQRPQFGQGMNPQDYRSQLQDWRGLRPQFSPFG